MTRVLRWRGPRWRAAQCDRPDSLALVSSIRFGISRLPPEDVPDEQFLDDLVAKGHRALELPFVDGFPWKEKRCQAFGELAAAP